MVHELIPFFWIFFLKFIHSSFVHSFIVSFIHLSGKLSFILSIHCFIHFFMFHVHSFLCSFSHSFISLFIIFLIKKVLTIYSFTSVYQFIHTFLSFVLLHINSFFCSFIHPLVHSLIHWITNLLVHSFIGFFVCLLIYLLNQATIHSFVCFDSFTTSFRGFIGGWALKTLLIVTVCFWTRKEIFPRHHVKRLSSRSQIITAAYEQNKKQKVPLGSVNSAIKLSQPFHLPAANFNYHVCEKANSKKEANNGCQTQRQAEQRSTSCHWGELKWTLNIWSHFS